MSLNIYVGANWKYNLVITDSSNPVRDVLEITKVVADGAELKRAVQISGLPQYGASMKFYGDTTKHIVGNWFN